MDSIKFVMVSVGAVIKTVTISMARWRCKSLHELLKSLWEQSLSNCCSKSGITAGQRLLYTLRFQPATSQTRNRGDAYSKPCPSVQSEGNKMAADRSVVCWCGGYSWGTGGTGTWNVVCRGEFRPKQTRQLPRVVDLKGRLLSCQSY